MAGEWDAFPLANERQSKEDAWSAFPLADAPVAPAPSVLRDVGKGIGSGVVSGVSGVAGLPGVADDAATWLYGQSIGRLENRLRTGSWDARTPEHYRQREAELRGNLPRVPRATDFFNPGAVQGAIEGVVGPVSQPETVPGQFAKTATEFAVGAGAFGARTLGDVLRAGVAPGVASEAAGQATQGTQVEPWARFGGALAGGMAGAMAARPSVAEGVIRGAVSGIDDAAIAKAQQLIDDAASMGVSLTPAEAINQVTGGAARRLAEIQRVVENSQGGAPRMNEFMAQRPAQVQRAGLGAIESVAPGALPSPTQTGIAIKKAAQGVVADTQAGINQVTRPLYGQARAIAIPDEQFAVISRDPLFAQSLKQVRSDPALNRTIADLPDNAVGTVDLVVRRMDELATNARSPGQASTSNLAARNFDDASRPALEAAETAAPTYAQANAQQRAMRAAELEPLREGKIGELSQTTDAVRQSRALFPSKPMAGGADETEKAISALVRKDPIAAQSIIRQHAETLFNENMQNLASGPNQFGGAKFAAQIVGNPEQRRALEAAVKALPGGDTRWKGFSRMIDVLEATGQRLQQGSATAFNAEINRELKGGGLVGEAANIAATGGVKLPGRIREAYENMRAGRNGAELAAILTDPKAIGLFGKLVNSKRGSATEQALTMRLLYAGEQSRRSAENSRQKPR